MNLNSGKHGLSLLRSSGDSIRRFDENAWIDVVTMEDFLELEELLELKDGEQLGDLDSSRGVTMEDFLELEEWLEDMDQNSKKNLDDDQHTSRGDLETSPKASIDRH
ncbi:hypothetical protein DY000_02016115 [Brassica cretica]|uniref:Uncharacterized protein n=1 Tax=Brassica cretica TaxID=69181 RepID=A0ABQ7D9C0_BRACR|nr:hypothetical protein DY000_02016115 [Brassica cretica]